MAESFTVDADFPGGNVVIDSIEGRQLRLRPDLRTTTPWWFYWYFRVNALAGAAGQTLRISLGDKRNLLGRRGPCHSPDGGRTWQWLGRECVEEDGFVFTFPPDFPDGDVRFAVSFPYVTEHLNAFCQARPGIERGVLGHSEQGRPIELLTLSSRRGTYLVPLTARLHACETMASFAMEGVLDFWLKDESPDGAFLREHVDLRAVPLFDVDGVEAGDQGKQRAPHDHNRDFTGAPIYAATRSFERELPRWRGKLVLSIDLHCPWITGGRNDELFLVGTPEPWAIRERAFTQILHDLQQGELRYDPRHTIPAGEDWNTGYAPTLAHYIRKQFDVRFACSFEVPYAESGGQTMTPDNTRQFGHDLARAIGRFIRTV